ncbi:MAG: acylphosphatase [bacterium]|nr:acylphosphatase [bacterium]
MVKLVRAHIFIDGCVQRVSFRAWTLRQAQGLQFVGWVKNLEDGRIEIIAEGEKKKVNQLIGLVKKGPKLAKVEHIDVSWEEGTGEFEEFSVVR